MQPLYFVRGLLETKGLLGVYAVKGVLQRAKQHLEYYKVGVRDAPALLLAEEPLERKSELVNIIREIGEVGLT